MVELTAERFYIKHPRKYKNLIKLSGYEFNNFKIKNP